MNSSYCNPFFEGVATDLMSGGSAIAMIQIIE
jgi:hypothetical protein